MKSPYKILADSPIKKEIFVFDDYEEAAFRITPSENYYNAFIKWAGHKEQSIDIKEKIVFEALLSGRIISEKEYREY